MKLQRKHSKCELIGLLPVLLLGIIVVTGCKSRIVKADDELQTTFATLEEAGEALQLASKSNNDAELTHVLGPDSKAVVNSGDPEEDLAALKSFVVKYERMNRWVAMTDGSRILFIGVDNYPFPIPLTQNASSRWYFNTTAGKDEIFARRIGRNELLTIDAIYAIGNAQELYFRDSHDGNPKHSYAQRILSSPGKKDGLYWKVEKSETSSPLGNLNEFAKDVVVSTPSGKDPVFDGYSFRILSAQGSNAKGGTKNYLANNSLSGGFAIMATPVSYANSGVMTFMMNREGIVYQKDLGPNTIDIAQSITTYNPDSGWTPAE